MGTRKYPTTGAVDRLYGILRSRPYEAMSIRAIMRQAHSQGQGWPAMGYHTVSGNVAHCRNRFFPYVRRVGNGVYMYTPGGALDHARYPEVHTRPVASVDKRGATQRANDELRAQEDGRLILERLRTKTEPVKIEEPVVNHITTITYRVLGELKDGGVLLVDSDGDIWEIKRLIEKSVH